MMQLLLAQHFLAWLVVQLEQAYDEGEEVNTTPGAH